MAPSLAGHWPGEALERQRVAYHRPLPSLSANGEYVTQIYVGTISLGGNLPPADGYSCDRNGRGRRLSGASPARAGGGPVAHSSGPRPPAAAAGGTARKDPAGRSGGGPAPGRDAQGATENAGSTGSPGKPGAARPQLAE